MSETQVVEFIDLVNHPNYEILNVYPFTIRRKDNKYVVSENIDDKGYYTLHLEHHALYKKHRLIAEQFLENPDNLPCIDHINRDRTDNRLINLRWVSHSENSKNRTSTKGIIYTFVDDIDEDSIMITDYGKHKFEDYYYDEKVDKFYFDNGQQYRELHINETKRGYKFVIMISTEGKKVQVGYAKFKKLYGLK